MYVFEASRCKLPCFAPRWPRGEPQDFGPPIFCSNDFRRCFDFSTPQPSMEDFSFFIIFARGFHVRQRIQRAADGKLWRPDFRTDMTDFAAIDFETANEQPCSVCSVGVVIVRGGLIADSFYSLIHPEPEYYQWFCRRVHGLGPEDTMDAPVFPFVWEKVATLIEGLPLVAHNARFDEASGCISWTIPTIVSMIR